MPNTWSSTIFECTKDPTVALLWCICPPFVSAQTAKKMGDDFNSAFIKSLCCGCFPCIGASARLQMRVKYDLPPEPCSDLIVHCCLGGCATCQEAREANVRELQVKPMTREVMHVTPPGQMTIQ